MMYFILFFFLEFYINSLFTLNSNTDKRHINTKEVMRKRDTGWGCGAVGLWGCGAVGLWGCGAVGLWGSGALGLWGSGALGAGGSAFRRRAASGRLSAALGGVEHACVRERRERAPRDSSKYKSL